MTGRTTKLTPMLLANLGCFTPNEIVKIMSMEPAGNIPNTPAVPILKKGVLADHSRPNTGGHHRGSYHE